MTIEWQFRLKPFPDELLSSWLARNACVHGLTPYRFCNLLLPGIPIWNRDIDRHAYAKLIADLAKFSGFRPCQIDEMTLRDTARVLGEERPGAVAPLILSAGVRQFNRTKHGLQYCPECISEKIYFKRIWRLGFSLVCTTHGYTLRDSCPKCDAPLEPHRVSHLDVSRCFACGAKLAEVSCNPFAHAAKAFQMECLGRLQRGSLGDHQWFRQLRILLGAASSTSHQRVLRAEFGLPTASAFRNAMFEKARVSERITMIECVAKWISDWPTTFREGATAIGLTQRSFSRAHVPACLKSEVARLPLGQRRRRVFKAKLFTSELLHKKRYYPSQYRQERATRLLDITFPSP